VTSGPKKPPKAFWHMRQWQMDGRPRRVTLKRTAPHWHPPVWASLSAMKYRLDIVAIRVDHEGTVIVLVIMGTRAGTAIVRAAIGHGRRIEGVHFGLRGGLEGIVTAGTGLGALGQPEIRLGLAIAANLDAPGILLGHFGQHGIAQR